MNVVITGGSGFLMRNFIDDYAQTPYFIAPRSKYVNWVTGKGIDTLPNEPDVFIHAAAEYGGLVYNQQNMKSIALNNIRMSANVLDYILTAKPKKIIMIGSACIYPGTVSSSLTEDMIGSGRMESTVEMYALTKFWLLAAAEKFMNNWIQLELANLYGPHDHNDYTRQHVVAALLYKFLKAKRDGTDVNLLGDGSPMRSLLYVKDATAIINHCMQNDLPNLPMNASSNCAITIRDMANQISEILDFTGNIVWDNQVSNNGAQLKILDDTSMNSFYPTRPITDFRFGIQATINHLKTHDPSLF